MSIDLLPATAEQAAAVQRKFNGDGRTIAEIPESIQELSDKTKVYIFNVGPWPHSVPCGSLGQKHIPACETGQLHSKPLAIDGLVIERYPLREGTMDLLMHKDATGWNVAHQIIGVGKHMAPGNSLERYGVGVSKTWPPSKAEIEKCKKNLAGHLNNLVNEARGAAAQGQKTADETIRGDQHILAAQMLGLNPKVELWMAKAVAVADTMECKFCGERISSGLAKCPNCKEVLNKKLYEKLQAE